MATKTSRSVPLKVTITPELHERLREVAAQLGQAPATVASMAIGQYVAQMSRTFGAAQTAVDAMVDRIAPDMSNALRQMTLADVAPPRQIPPPARNALAKSPTRNALAGAPRSKKR